MDLLEYQAKELFAQVGLPILPSQAIFQPSDIKRLKIPYPVVLKSQVAASNRGKAGGVKFVDNTIDAITAARTIFNLTIGGESPEVILAESHYQSSEEIFLAIILDYSLQIPVLLGSRYGGTDIDKLYKNLQKVPLQEEFSPFYARRLAIMMGLDGVLLVSIADVIEKMYSLFISQDLDLIEINPLGISKIGNVMALDGKINVNDLALPRHPQFKQAISTNKSIRLNKTGNIGIITNGWGIALRTLDALAWQKGTPNTCIIVEDVFCSHAWKNALQELRKIKDIKVIFLHLIDSPFIQEIVNTALGKFIAKTNVPYVVSLFEQTELLGTLEKSTNFYPSPSLDDAVLRVVQEAKK